ncbi:MAG: GNAT family N-acetyltransferase [Kineosporiaceae bacterium]
MTEELRTDRLLLRRWRDADAAPMAAINRDPEVAQLLNRRLDDAGIDGFHAMVAGHWDAHGYGPWAVERCDTGEFLGFAGLALVPPLLADAGAGVGPELGWRLARTAWGHGFATEAAAAARDDAFARLGLAELISIIHPDNVRSQRVAVKLGMNRARQVPNPLLGIDVDVWSLAAPAR